MLHAVRATQSPVVDGDLSDAAWQSAPEFTDFTQHDPDDGKPATMPTSVRIVYDDNAIYFGAKMDDPQRPPALLARRDNVRADATSSPSTSTRSTTASPATPSPCTPANVQIDMILYNDIGEDCSWDGVWDSAAKIVPDGWIAEVRIPYLAAAVSGQAGARVGRQHHAPHACATTRCVRIVNTKKGETGFVSHFADIDGIEGIHRGEPLELVPYGVARSDVLTRADRNNPLHRSATITAPTAGLDVKYALTSNLTLTGTINPDFGQVEVDPAVVNLSQFETFYPEKRPFFTEGLNIFRFGDTPAPSHFNFFFPPSLFYTRRIGRAPQGIARRRLRRRSRRDHDPRRGEGHRQDAGNGWSIGVLDALTDAEHARFVARRERRTAAGRADDELLRLARHEGDRRRLARRLHAHVGEPPPAGRAVVRCASRR